MLRETVGFGAKNVKGLLLVPGNYVLRFFIATKTLTNHRFCDQVHDVNRNYLKFLLKEILWSLCTLIYYHCPSSVKKTFKVPYPLPFNFCFELHFLRISTEKYIVNLGV